MRQGFTLIEVVLAAGILALAAVAIVPIWSALMRQTADTGRRDRMQDAQHLVEQHHLRTALTGGTPTLTLGNETIVVQVEVLDPKPPQTMLVRCRASDGTTSETVRILHAP